MRNAKLFSAAMLVTCALTANAQVPSHPQYIQKVPTYVSSDHGETLEQSFDMYFETWEPGVPLTEDDNFFISRVKQRARFVDTNTQVNPEMTQDRKMCWWCPIGISDKSWSAIPRYILNADNFSMWQYLDIHGDWSDGWIRVPAAFSDAAHRNGVENGCILFFDSSVSANSSTGKILSKLIEKNGDGTFKNAVKLIRFMKYYGVDGLGVNPEGSLSSSMVEPLKSFFEECHKVAIEEGWHFKVHWYESMTNGGGVSWTDQLSMNNNEWFQRQGKDYPVTDMFMLNYNWTGDKLPNSAAVARSLGRSSFDVYAGFDTQGRWITDGYSGDPNGGWVKLKKNDISLAMWGSHVKNMVYENSNELGSDALTLQTTYQKKLEQFFTGGTQNPANCPAITNQISSSSWNAMKKFHGISSFIPARSVLNQLPFVTRFGLGNGQFFNQEGQTVFANEWYNLGVQDFLPTWRWWVLDDSGNVPEDPIHCEFTFEDAWHAGSALKLSGATKKSNIRMFKTDFTVTDGTEITVRYKVKDGTEPHLNLIWSADGTTFKSYPMAAIPTANTWGVTTFRASDAGMTGKVVSLGFSVENTNGNYELLLGELSINDHKSYNPVKPTITSHKVLEGRYNEIDFKLIYKSKDQNPDKPWEPIYNEDVDTWYFEIYTQAKDGQPVLCATTTSWGAYVVGAPADMQEMDSKFGVCAVAPDGITRSEIAWTDYETRTVTQVDDVEIDKSVIKANEEFTVKFKDPTHKKSRSWQIINSASQKVITTKSNVTSLTYSLAEEGSYDLLIKSSVADAGTRICGLIQISPEATGAIPTIDALSVDNNEIKTGENTTATVNIKRLGEGKVSRGLAVRDPEMLMLPKEVASSAPYSIAMWFKVEKFAHGQYGTNLINKRNIGIKWPHNNWGDFWVHIWPKVYQAQTTENIISYTQANQPDGEGNVGFNGNKHESPNKNCMTEGYGITPNTWNHIVITATANRMQLWLNGHLMASQNKAFELNSASKGEGVIYIGGTNVYHGGLIGVIDELQLWNKELSEAEVADAMKGYKGRTIPDALTGYWDFENVATEGEGVGSYQYFANTGKGGDIRAKMIKFEGAGGEDTGGTTIATVNPDNSELGNPAIEGSMDVKTSVNWNMKGASMTENGNSAIASYSAPGSYTISVDVVNGWGKDSREDVVVVTSATGIEGTESDAVSTIEAYPNPFVDAVNVMFAKDGQYSIDVFTIGGKQVSSEVLDAKASEVARITIDGDTGMYLVRIMNNGVCVKTLKLNKVNR